MSRPDAGDYARGPKRPDDTGLMRPALRPVPRPAIERLQAVVAQSAPADEPGPAPRGRRKFRDQTPEPSGPARRRKH